MAYNNLSKTDILLLSHNISPALKGYTFIKYILENEYISLNTRFYDLYNKLSNVFETSPSAIEQGIKYALKNSDFIKKNNKRNLILLAHEFKTN